YPASIDLSLPPRRRLTAAEHRRLSRRYKARRALRAYAFLAPVFVFFSVFLVVPCIWLLWGTFHAGGVYGPSEFVGLENWKTAFSDPLVRTTIENTFSLALMSIPPLFLIGLGLALLLLNLRRGGAALRAALYFPTLAPLVIVASIWLFVIHPDFGALNLGLRMLGGGSVNWLGDTQLSLPTLAMVEVWRGIGFWSLFFLAALISLPRELYEAAHLDGTNAWQRFRYLTLPLLRRTFLFAIVLSVINTLQTFDTVFVMTNGGPANSTATVAWYIYESIYVFDEAGFGATLSFVLLLMILALTLIAMRLLRARRMT
ncbi:MAG: sugar ABC transporter permease, partial [Gaiellaceae bacterium MAG52_C11]|nr:sugar ABC transporter permease [Candidatus Gaiellasilicea maunaloa]